MLYCDAATFCRRRNDAGIMTDETGRRCAQESIDIIIMKNNYNYLFIIKIILITYLVQGCLLSPFFPFVFFDLVEEYHCLLALLPLPIS